MSFFKIEGGSVTSTASRSVPNKQAKASVGTKLAGMVRQTVAPMPGEADFVRF